MKNVVGGFVHSSELVACIVVILMGVNIPLTIACSIASLICASKLYDNIRGNYVNNSIFSVSRDGKIVQNGMASPSKMLSFLGRSKKLDVFKEEAMKMFSQLKEKNKKGENLVYKTKSQGMTVKLLKYMKANGYVDNLEYTEAGNSHLIFEKFVFGNLKSIGKKNKIYDIKFTLTDKNRSDLSSLFEPQNKIVEEKNNVDNSEKISYLKRLKEKLIYEKRKKYEYNDNTYEESIHKNR